jgi:hypothetical protein
MHIIPRVDELARRGLAHPIAWTAQGAPTRYNIHPEGHALLGRLMRENGLELQMQGSAEWTQPPSRLLPGLVGE